MAAAGAPGRAAIAVSAWGERERGGGEKKNLEGEAEAEYIFVSLNSDEKPEKP